MHFNMQLMVIYGRLQAWKLICQSKERQAFPYGTHASVMPHLGSTNREWSLITTFTKELKNPQLGGILQVQGGETENGETQVRNFNFTGAEMNLDQALIGIVQVAQQALMYKENLESAQK